MLWITKLGRSKVYKVHKVHNVERVYGPYDSLVKKVPSDTEFQLCRVDWIGVSREIIPAPEELVEVFVFNKQVGSLDIQRDEYIHFRVVSGFLDLLIVELHDCRVVRVGIKRGVVEQVYTDLESQGLFEKAILVVVVRVKRHLG